jgi:hypothetical protein
MVRRRPVTAEDIAASLGSHPDEIRTTLASLVSATKIRPSSFKDKIYFSKAG